MNSNIYYLSKEENLLTELAIIVSDDFKDKIRDEFHSSKNSYDFQSYINNLERVKRLCLQGFNDENDVIRLIRTRADNLV